MMCVFHVPWWVLKIFFMQIVSTQSSSEQIGEVQIEYMGNRLHNIEKEIKIYWFPNDWFSNDFQLELKLCVGLSVKGSTLAAFTRLLEFKTEITFN